MKTVGADARPIGVFDSGVGGLTIVRALSELLPDESLVYFGDTAHLPYGDKSPETLQGYVREIVCFLKTQHVKAVVVACNTASAVALEAVKQAALDLPVFEVITPAVLTAAAVPGAKKIGVIGTATTIRSGIYGKKLRALSPEFAVIEKATPLLVPMIEENWLAHELSVKIIEAYLSDTGFLDIDALILGCTHYLLVEPHIRAYFRENLSKEVALIDSAHSTAAAVADGLKSAGLLAPESVLSAKRYYVSDITPGFEIMARNFLGAPLRLVRVQAHDI